ncbi:MAG: hypothetical protein OEZ38_01950 [Gammaproteobacteria bacterium]|nr:hypothetical protein [Gammaproteobacteria bacterium]
MALLMPSAIRLYRVLAILGFLIVVISVLYAWVKINQYEISVVNTYENAVRTSMEVDAINDELKHIEKALQAVGQEDNVSGDVVADGISYSSYEIERLRAEKANLLLFKKEKELDLASTSHVKKYVMNEIRLLFIIMIIVLFVGILLTVLGILGWYLKIELFEDRRKKPR